MRGSDTRSSPHQLPYKDALSIPGTQPDSTITGRVLDEGLMDLLLNTYIVLWWDMGPGKPSVQALRNVTLKRRPNLALHPTA